VRAAFLFTGRSSGRSKLPSSRNASFREKGERDRIRAEAEVRFVREWRSRGEKYSRSATVCFAARRHQAAGTQRRTRSTARKIRIMRMSLPIDDDLLESG